MPTEANWGTVNLGVDVLQGHGEQSQPGYNNYIKEHPGRAGKQQYNPGRNQELKLPPDIFRMSKDNDNNPYSPTGKISTASVHERIKELLGEGAPRREAVLKAKKEAQLDRRGDTGTISKKEIYRSKYQAESPGKQVSPLQAQVQNYPFM
jgi:hypothetical protein